MQEAVVHPSVGCLVKLVFLPWDGGVKYVCNVLFWPFGPAIPMSDLFRLASKAASPTIEVSNVVMRSSNRVFWVVFFCPCLSFLGWHAELLHTCHRHLCIGLLLGVTV